MKLIINIIIVINCIEIAISAPLSVFEDFTTAGQPYSENVTWRYRSQLSKVTDWSQIIPGDGYAYLKVNSRIHRVYPDIRWPFQMLIITPVGPGHSITIKAKNMVMKGVASFIFTYTDADGKLSEIDLEIVDRDRDKNSNKPIKRERDKTDLRMNIWHKASLVSDTAERYIHRHIIDNNEGVVHGADKFHTYQLNWQLDKVSYYIDNIKQGEFYGNIPTREAELNIGVRHMSWTGILPAKPQVMIIDWIKISPI
jgi:hypothetical protein